jgi:hypothetical protein
LIAGPDLVIWGEHLFSNVGLPRFSTLVASMNFVLPPYFKVIIVGLILGDAELGFLIRVLKMQIAICSRLNMRNIVCTLQSHYCASNPSFRTSIRNGVRLFSLQLYTRSLRCFTELHSMFDLNGIKVIPAIIFELLTPVAFAHWIMV